MGFREGLKSVTVPWLRACQARREVSGPRSRLGVLFQDRVTFA
jgi:hypothetical protein